MKTIVIKNVSTLWDEVAVMIAEMHTASKRNKEYDVVFKDAKLRHRVNVKISESTVENKVTYTITDIESENEQR